MLFLIYEIFRLLIINFLSEKKHMSFDCVTVTVDQLLALSHSDSLRLKIINCCLFQRKVVSELLIWMNLTEVDGSILVGFIFLQCYSYSRLV